MKILEIILILIFLALTFSLLILLNNTLECYFFYHKDWILWEKVIKNFNKKIFYYKYNDGTILYNITIDGIQYKMYYWPDESISLHSDGYTLCSYDKYHQKKVRKLFEKELI